LIPRLTTEFNGCRFQHVLNCIRRLAMSTTAPLSRRQRRAVLGVVALALMMVVAAVSGLNVALPDLARDTGATQSQLQWIVDAYTVVFAGLLLAAGAVGDRYGRRGVLLAGLVLFGAAAAGAMTTRDPAVLIALRAVMGVGAAAVMPVTLSVVTTSFPPEERGRAVGIWTGIAGGGGVLGLLGSGVLLRYFAWNSFFALNVVLAGLALLGAVRIMPNSRDAHPPAFDAPGALLSLASVAGLVFGIIEVPERGWRDSLTLGALALGALALGGFVTWELRRAEPMLDPRLFRLPGFGTGALSIMVQFFAVFGFFFVGMQYLQFVAGFSPLKAALALLPLPAVLLPLSRRAPDLAERFGVNRVGAAGLVLLAGGLVLLSRVSVDLIYWRFAIGLVVFAAGMALAATPATTAIVASLPLAKQGVASAVNDTSREFGSALGIALLGSIVNDRYRAGLTGATAALPPEVARRATGSLAFAESDAIRRMGPAGAALAAAAQRSFVDGIAAALLAAAGAALAAAVYVALRAPGQAEEAALRPEERPSARAASVVKGGRS